MSDPDLLAYCGQLHAHLERLEGEVADCRAILQTLERRASLESEAAPCAIRKHRNPFHMQVA